MIKNTCARKASVLDLQTLRWYCRCKPNRQFEADIRGSEIIKMASVNGEIKINVLDLRSVSQHDAPYAVICNYNFTKF